VNQNDGHYVLYFLWKRGDGRKDGDFLFYGCGWGKKDEGHVVVRSHVRHFRLPFSTSHECSSVCRSILFQLEPSACLTHSTITVTLVWLQLTHPTNASCQPSPIRPIFPRVQGPLPVAIRVSGRTPPPRPFYSNIYLLDGPINRKRLHSSKREMTP